MNQANGSEALLLDYTRSTETFCIETGFRIYNRGGVTDASGEISKKSVFSQGVNILWQALKPTKRQSWHRA